MESKKKSEILKFKIYKRNCFLPIFLAFLLPVTGRKLAVNAIFGVVLKVFKKFFTG
tara:strand:+ start:349 stop:516 length:168 start_codon:yes stop_codon:yes gene_type:complete